MIPIRVRFGWEGIEKIQVCEAVSWEVLDEFEEAWIHPREFYMTSEESFNLAIEDIEHELEDRVGWFQEKGWRLRPTGLKEGPSSTLRC